MKYEHIAQLREDNNMTAPYLSKKIGMDSHVYANCEKGEQNFSPEDLIKLAHFHGTSVDYLLGLTDVKMQYPS